MTDLVKGEGFNLTPRNLDEAMQYAKLISDSDLAPKDYRGKPGNVIIAIQMGQELGLKPMQAIQNIAVINGRPSIYGDALLAVVMAHSDFIDIQETCEKSLATCTITRRGRTPVTKSFSMDDAKKAGLAGKPGPWTQYPDRMLQMRARTFCCRDVFPDALRGIHSVEEASDLPPLQCTVVEESTANNANKRLGYSGPEMPPRNLKDALEALCAAQSKSELKRIFEMAKEDFKHNVGDLAELIMVKDKVKEKFDLMEKQTAAPLPTVEEWTKDFVGDETEEVAE